MRHLSPYQCQICGKRFGKRHANIRHDNKRYPCQLVGGRNSKRVFWVSSELWLAVKVLEEARGYDNVMAVIQTCKHICSECSLQSQQETTILNSMLAPPDLQSLSSLPPDYFADEAPEQTPAFFLLGVWPWTTEYSTALSNSGMGDMEWTGVFGEQPSSTRNY